MTPNIKELNSKLLKSIDKSYPIGLSQGLMGIVIYFYHLSITKKGKKHKAIADQLLDDTLNRLSFNTSISVENGLSGIGLGITYLIKSGFIDGDINKLLEDIDNTIFENLVFHQSDSSYEKKELLLIIYYLHTRLTLQNEEDNIFIYQELIIKIINIFASKFNNDFFNEPFSFSIDDFYLPLFSYICACLLKQNFYNDRILKIIEQHESIILSKIPLLHANRLYMLCGILPLIPYMKSPKWKLHARLLQKSIELQVILNKELKNKCIFINNGLSFIYLLLYYLEKNHPDYKIHYNPQIFYERIIISEAWESLLKHDYFFEAHQGLLQGFPGVQLILLHIQKQKS